VEFFPTIIAGIIATFVGGLCLQLFQQHVRDDHLKRFILVIEGLYYYGLLGWIIARCFFSYNNIYHVPPENIDFQWMKTAFWDIFYNEITPLGHLIMTAGGVVGLVIGIWYPEKVLAFRYSGRRKNG
jgi:hypothetical protein